MEARQALVNSGHVLFQKDSQRTDLLDENATQTGLIAYLSGLVAKGYHFALTAVYSDHHDDTDLNPAAPYTGTHAHGWAADLWPLVDATPGNWVDPGTEAFRQFLRDAASSPWCYQIGLAGNGPDDPTNYADSPANMEAAGPTAFHDDGGPHCHLGAAHN